MLFLTAALAAPPCDLPDPAICAQRDAVLASLPDVDPDAVPYVELSRPNATTLVHDARTLVQPCYRALLAERDHAGPVRVVGVISPEGPYAALSVVGEGFEGAFDACTTQVDGLRTGPKGEGLRWTHVELDIGHRALLAIKPLANYRGDVARDVAKVGKGMQGWADAIEACAVGRPVRTLNEPSFHLKVTRGGEPKKIEMTQSSDDPVIDACILEAITASTTASTQTSPKLALVITLLQPTEDGP